MDEGLLTIDELAAAHGLTVRTTRYYASLGMLPPPIRRGRVAYYGPEHRARLDLVTTLQEHGFTLSAIERHLAELSADATPDEIEIQRDLLTAWAPAQWEEVDLEEVHQRAGRRLSRKEISWLSRTGSLVPVDGGRYRTVPFLHLAVELHDAGFPLDAIRKANDAVRQHMDALVEELQSLAEEGLREMYDGEVPAADDPQLGRVLGSLTRLSLEAVFLGFQRAQRRLRHGTPAEAVARPRGSRATRA